MATGVSVTTEAWLEAHLCDSLNTWVALVSLAFIAGSAGLDNGCNIVDN